MEMSPISPSMHHALVDLWHSVSCSERPLGSMSLGKRHSKFQISECSSWPLVNYVPCSWQSVRHIVLTWLNSVRMKENIFASQRQSLRVTNLQIAHCSVR